jgi:hypothetical protein
MPPVASAPAFLASSPPQVRASRWPSGLDWVGLLAVALLGLFQVAMPFSGDQALFTVGGRQLLDGSVFYRDFWDVKQPGIYLFYMAGGVLLGFTEVGIHLFEVLWNLVFAAGLQRFLRPRLRSARVAALAPLLVQGVYYAAEDLLGMTQLEALVGLPLFVGLWACISTSDRRTARLFLAGIATGAVVAFKLVYLPLGLVFWLFPAWDAVRGPRPVRSFLAVAAPLLLGLAIPVGAMLGYVALHDIGAQTWWTTVVYPATTTAIEGRPWSRLLLLPPQILDLLGVSVVPAVVGLVLRGRKGIDRFTVACLAWLGVALPLFAIQHWWSYHVPLFLPPLALLAARGIDEALARGMERRSVPAWIAAAALALALVFPLKVLAFKGYNAATFGFGVTPEDRQALQDRMQTYYVSARQWARMLSLPDATPGPVYVIGSPIALYLSGRDQAIPQNGWAVDQFDGPMWQRMARQLAAAPPPYLAIRHVSGEFLKERSREMTDLLARLYCRDGGSTEDAWYRLRGPKGCQGDVR